MEVSRTSGIGATGTDLPHCAVEDASYGPVPCVWKNNDGTVAFYVFRARPSECANGGLRFHYPAKNGVPAHDEFECD